MNRRNPIRRHSDGPSEHFTIVPNELVRETNLTPYAYQLGIVIRSHADGYEVSMKSLADTLGWKRDTVRKAMDDLVTERWLAVRRHETASGTRAFEEYHLNVARKFTEEEATEFNRTVVLPARQTGNQVPTKRATPCPSNGHPPARQTGTKEDHLEDYLEDQEENHSRTNSDIGDGWGEPLPVPAALTRPQEAPKKTFTWAEHKAREAAEQQAVPHPSRPNKLGDGTRRCIHDGCPIEPIKARDYCPMHVVVGLTMSSH